MTEFEKLLDKHIEEKAKEIAIERSGENVTYEILDIIVSSLIKAKEDKKAYEEVGLKLGAIDAEGTYRGLLDLAIELYEVIESNDGKEILSGVLKDSGYKIE